MRRLEITLTMRKAMRHMFTYTEICFFHSEAQDDAFPTSDVDLLILLEKNEKQERIAL